jgi:DNA polymerase III epsilon subunit-like protein
MKELRSEYHIVKPQWKIPEDSVAIHGITQEKAEAEGKPLSTIIGLFLDTEHDKMVAHNMNFDYNVLVHAILWDLCMPTLPHLKPRYCTMEFMRSIMRLPTANDRGYKNPKLSELYEYVMKKKPEGTLHNAQTDTRLLAEIIKNSSLLQKMIDLSDEPIILPNAAKKARVLII